ncbi:hypothetical protein LTR10_015455 [Elasticomyces elasticus]|uniref:Uncharacterized protein n=1 Tax=Exophiala sideris TaxID=1016849 RepID=A0ABR0J487_9EURO|nr:hypothetical protein LTR10_015455 [Elasticomyces elasticus]KAK5026954.1 hypothetical protein LTS07_007253 [Exophiala sideris]KAK5033958.1 hypothetical protein LTR13_006558 [Exophiala sideris]KAK5055768.1 hypothetical protein LTR69_008143 [Exophiala sideris]KAK5180900.1 hypothetical protein LTR44_006720 [Eurotiomycetes sp. CCFEE 6388]
MSSPRPSLSSLESFDAAWHSKNSWIGKNQILRLSDDPTTTPLGPSNEEPPTHERTEYGRSIAREARHLHRQFVEGGLSTGFTYSQYRPALGTDAETTIKKIFELHTNADANEILQYSVVRNLWVLNLGHKAMLNDEERIRSEARRLLYLHPSAVLDDLARSWRMPDAWSQILHWEVKLSKYALLRLEYAAEARRLLLKGDMTAVERKNLKAVVDTWTLLRDRMAQLMRHIHFWTGGREFLERHNGELWDIVEER